MRIRNFRLLFISAGAAVLVAGIKFCLHLAGLEGIELGSLHTSVIAGTIFVVGFLLSTSIADYKESERIPAEFSATIENMAEDARRIHANYPGFDLAAFRAKLSQILRNFKADVRNGTHEAHNHIYDLHGFFHEMEKANVPPNFITKLKQEQATLTKNLFRVSYIQRITVIPSASILTYAIVTLALTLLLFTEIEPFYGGLGIVMIITLILVYIVMLIRLISTPFHTEGRTQDDVSMFLIDEVDGRLSDDK